ncbi:Bcr/CflA family efflux MFS transporter [Streptomyces sp. NPDC000348]|uniref:Bcr/CflA family efflux MFS transporter n=1 Tax=Streptomyces sp. NPDC000348 TaxID=3364538 RepID=UPI003678CDB3
MRAAPATRQRVDYSLHIHPSPLSGDSWHTPLPSAPARRPVARRRYAFCRKSQVTPLDFAFLHIHRQAIDRAGAFRGAPSHRTADHRVGLTDRGRPAGHGRRRLLLGGSALFTVFSLACAAAPNVEVLTAARLLEGTAGAAGMVISRAVLTDLYRGADVARHFSVLSMILGVAPVAAPVIGGLIATGASWRAVFLVLAGFGLMLVLAVWRWVPESLPAERRQRGGLPAAFRAMGRLTRQRAFMGHVLVLSCASAALFAYIAGSPLVFQDIHGASATGYSLIFAVNALGMLVASGLVGALSRRLPLTTLLSVGVGLAVVGTLAQAAIVLTTGGSLITTWGCLFLTMFGTGLTITTTYTLGQTAAARAAGGASAMLGGGQFLLGGLVSPLVGAFGESSPTPMAVIMCIGFVCSAAMLVLLVRPWQRRGADRTTK